MGGPRNGSRRINNEDKRIRIGTRGSRLARAQTDWVMRELSGRHRDIEFEVIFIKTTGDAVTDRPLAESGGTGLFTKEIENALLDRRIDCAVHSLKDLPTEQPDGLELAAIPVRSDARDVLAGMKPEQIAAASKTVTIGTGSRRRAAQMRLRFPSTNIVDLRGNVDTRLRKIDDGIVDCAVLAAAGLKRLGLGHRITALLEPEIMLPAPAQGALGIEARIEDLPLRDVLASVHCSETERCVTAERAVLSALGGGCQVPVGALASIRDDTLSIEATVVSLDGNRELRTATSGRPEDAEKLGEELAQRMIDQGAEPIIQDAMQDLKQGEDNV